MQIPVHKIFLVFLKMGSLAFGGVYSMLALIEKEVIEKRKWITAEEFTEDVTLGQLTPGAPIINTGILIGYRLAGFPGAFACAAGQILPGFLLIITLSTVYLHYSEAPYLRSAIKGIGAGVIALIFSVVLNLGKKLERSYYSLFFFLSSLFCVIVLKLSPVLVLFIAAFAGMSYYQKKTQGSAWK